jgi:hypothetical protein
VEVRVRMVDVEGEKLMGFCQEIKGKRKKKINF